MGDSVSARRGSIAWTACAVSFSCPHFEIDQEHCRLLKTDCVPGRRGCVLGSKAVFAVPAEERVRAREEEKRRRAFDAVARESRG